MDRTPQREPYTGPLPSIGSGPTNSAGAGASAVCESARVVCELCETELPPGTPARIDRESGVIICVECFEGLTNESVV